MAILIPSKNIYDKQNPKVRDNVIERVEVGAVEVVPKNGYEEVVYNENLNIKQAYISGDTSGGETRNTRLFSDLTAGETTMIGMLASGNIIYDKYSTISEIKINKVLNNALVSKIYAGLKSADSSYTQVSKSVEEKIYMFEAQNGYYYGSSLGGDINTFLFNDIRANTYKKYLMQKGEQQHYNNFGKYYTKVSLILGEEGNISVTRNENQENDSVTYVSLDSGKLTGLVDVAESDSTLEIDEPYKTKQLEIEETDDFFIVKNIKVLTERTMYCCYAHVENGVVGEHYPARVVEITQKVKSAEISIYGDTIGIDLEDKTVYIPETDKTNKKVFSVDGNELMQTSNIFYEKQNALVKDRDYEIFETEIAGGDFISFNISLKTAYETPVVVSYLDENEEIRNKIIEVGEKNAYIIYDPRGGISILSVYETQSKNQLYYQFDKTKKLYSKGKETATVRCSISDYFDYASNEKLIAIDNSTGKMSFKMYDQVIPMVYGADGKDRPMSTYQDGSPKVFQVLGTNIYYDGAVWQELSLQEIDKSEIL